VRPPLYTRLFWHACAVHFSGGMGLALFILFPLYVRELGGTEWTIGVVTGAGAASAVASRPVVGRWLDRLGRRTLLVGAGALHVASCVLYIGIDRLDLTMVVITVLHGIAGGALFATYFTYAADIIPPSRRAEGTAMFGLAGMLPNGLGPLLGEWLIGQHGFDAFFGCAAAWGLLSLVLSFGLTEAPDLAFAGMGPRAGRFWALLRGRLLGPVMLTTFFFGIGLAALFTFLSPFARDAGLGQVGGFFLSYALAAAVTRILGSRLPDVVGVRPVLLPALVLLAAGLLAVSLVRDAGTLPFVGAVCGAAHGYIFPVLNTVAVNRAPQGERGTVVSLYTAMVDLGATLGGPLLGGVAYFVGYPSMFVIAAMLVGAGVGVMARVDREPDDRPVDAHSTRAA
jgi:predicted MFS family arabinose efflux permease